MNNTRSIIAVVAIAVLSLLATPSHALVTVDYTAQIGQRNVVSHQNALISDGSGEVRIGVLPDHFDAHAYGDDLIRLHEAWINLGTTEIREILGEGSRFSANTSFSRPDLEGEKLFLWVLSTNDGAPVKADYSNVSDTGLYSSTEALWVVPSHTAIPPRNSTLINSSQIDQRFGAAGFSATSLHLAEPARADYPGWAVIAFPEEMEESEMLPNADPDMDGLQNGIEQYIGTDPLAAEFVSPISLAVKEDGSIAISLLRARSVPAGSGMIEASSDLNHWVPLGPGLEITGLEIFDGGAREWVHYRLTHELSASAQLFVRLRVD